MLISKGILGVSLLLFATALATAAIAEEKHYSWQKDPGPISGRWSVTCEEMAGMVVDFSVDGKKATGRISNLGKAGVFSYAAGEEIRAKPFVLPAHFRGVEHPADVVPAKCADQPLFAVG